jgi:putative flippase GtrA
MKIIKLLLDFVYRNRHLMVKYAIVGVSSMVIDFGILYILTDVFGVYYITSATASFIVAASFNYFFNRHWTFRSSGSRRKQLPVFFTIAIIGVAINNSIMYAGVEQFGIWYIYAKIVATAIVTVWNFFGNKYLTFRIK